VALHSRWKMLQRLPNAVELARVSGLGRRRGYRHVIGDLDL
jgi:hypothetical protein